MTYSEMSLDEALALRHELETARAKRTLWYIYVILSVIGFVFFLNEKTWLLSVMIALALVVVVLVKNKKHEIRCDLIFGLPGSGKTTLIAHDTAKAHKKGIPTYTNVPIAGAYKLDPNKDLGFYDIRNAEIQIDEAGICWNNRNFSKFPPELIEWLKLHRHYGCSVKVYSQSYNDCDITVRRLCGDMWLCRRHWIPGVFCAIPIRRSIGINEMTQEICDKYSFDPKILRIFTTRYYIGRKYWHMFDSYDAPLLPSKKFERWTQSECGQNGAVLKADTML